MLLVGASGPYGAVVIPQYPVYTPLFCPIPNCTEVLLAFVAPTYNKAPDGILNVPKLEYVEVPDTVVRDFLTGLLSPTLYQNPAGWFGEVLPLP